MAEVTVGDLLDRFRLTQLINRGPASSIFKATDIDRGTTVAIKVPHPAFEADPVFSATLAREERIERRLNHPGVIRTLPPDERSRPYLVTEYVEGVPLRARMRPHEPLETAEALSITRQLVETTAYLHSEHVIHRDLKPENVLLLAGGGIKILDFGLALDHPRRLFAWLGATTVGTPDYMAPEQAKGLPGDERSDIYALGVTLYEMLTGELPFPSDDPVEVMLRKVGSDPLPPTRYRPELSPALEEIILHAIERRPANRYATVVALAADIRDPARVHPTGRAARLHSRSRREIIIRRVVRYVGVGLATVGGLVYLVWLANRYPAGPSTTAPTAQAVPAPTPR